MIDEQLKDIMDYVDQNETAEGWALTLKLSEEVGEFSETILKHYGYLAHKELKEDPMHEAADVMNVLVSILVKVYPHLTVNQILEQFSVAFEKKCNKYKRIMDDNESR